MTHFSISPDQLRQLAKELENDIGETATKLYLDTMTGKVSPFEMGRLVGRRSLLLGMPAFCRALALGLDNLNGDAAEIEIEAEEDAAPRRKHKQRDGRPETL
jgi:hypothetical protein